jgi:diacylglycerol kinase (ATP)
MTDPLKGKSNKILIIENPKSGQGNSSLDQFKVLLVAQGYLLEIRLLQSAVQTAELLTDAAKFDYIIAAGGDGTVCSVAHALKNIKIPILAFPAGTANLIAQNLGLPDNPAELLKILLKGRTIDIDVPELEADGVKTGFIVAAGAGVDAEMIRASEELKPTLGIWAYIAGALKQTAPIKARFSLDLDGRIIETEGIAVLVANLGMINLRIPIASGIDPADGYLNVIVLKGENLLSIIPNVVDSLRKWLGAENVDFAKHLEIYSCRSINVTAEPPAPIQYDGEVLSSTTPFRVTVRPRAARFICSTPEVST